MPTQKPAVLDEMLRHIIEKAQHIKIPLANVDDAVIAPSSSMPMYGQPKVSINNSLVR
ncbi:hypothetical protein [Cupriavidus sp. SW-Y-13]|uniref:hypothetical protein n=1 Tax=Cupriavidus sp. SW-Y-13 TaxID=2653854 RepID=UPI001365DCD4|nr:hypothetical protein [Cupriavidus sp. SW-Y-13]